MNNYRKLYILYKDYEKVLKWKYKNSKQLKKYCIKVYYIYNDSFQIYLYGYDNTLKWFSNDINDFNKVFLIVKKMPMATLRLC